MFKTWKDKIQAASDYAREELSHAKLPNVNIFGAQGERSKTPNPSDDNVDIPIPANLQSDLDKDLLDFTGETPAPPPVPVNSDQPAVGQEVEWEKDGQWYAAVLRYVGPVDGKSGTYYGIELEQPVGLNDGTVNERHYFQCVPRHGIFLNKLSKLRPRHAASHDPQAQPSAEELLSAYKARVKELEEQIAAQSAVIVEQSAAIRSQEECSARATQEAELWRAEAFKSVQSASQPVTESGEYKKLLRDVKELQAQLAASKEEAEKVSSLLTAGQAAVERQAEWATERANLMQLLGEKSDELSREQRAAAEAAQRWEKERAALRDEAERLGGRAVEQEARADREFLENQELSAKHQEIEAALRRQHQQTLTAAQVEFGALKRQLETELVQVSGERDELRRKLEDVQTTHPLALTQLEQDLVVVRKDRETLQAEAERLRTRLSEAEIRLVELDQMSAEFVMVPKTEMEFLNGIQRNIQLDEARKGEKKGSKKSPKEAKDEIFASSTEVKLWEKFDLDLSERVIDHLDLRDKQMRQTRQLVHRIDLVSSVTQNHWPDLDPPACLMIYLSRRNCQAPGGNPPDSLDPTKFERRDLTFNLLLASATCTRKKVPGTLYITSTLICFTAINKKVPYADDLEAFWPVRLIKSVSKDSTIKLLGKAGPGTLKFTLKDGRELAFHGFTGGRSEILVALAKAADSIRHPLRIED